MVSGSRSPVAGAQISTSMLQMVEATGEWLIVLGLVGAGRVRSAAGPISNESRKKFAGLLALKGEGHRRTHSEA